MNLRLLPWAVFAAVVAVLAFRANLPGEGAGTPATVRGTAGSALEIRLSPVEVGEFNDDGTWNLLVAEEAVYSYVRKTVQGAVVVVSLGKGKGFEGAVIRAAKAFWDFNGKSISLPEGGHADGQGGWKGELTPAALDLAGRILRAPGEVTLSGPGLSVSGRNLEWHWPDGKISLDTPWSRIAPAAFPARKG